MEAIFKSPDKGETLTFNNVTQGLDNEFDFCVSIATPWCSAKAPSTTYLNGSPSLLFKDLANNWQGWIGEKRWDDLEGRVALIATCDKLGHVYLNIEMQGGNYKDSINVTLQFDAGQLDQMANEITELLG